MKEVKFVSHISRNFYLYFLALVVLKLVFDHQLDLSTFLIGMLAYAVGYAPVYFINDSQDFEEDKKEGKHNLYTTIANPPVFWMITGSLVLIGGYLGLITSPLGYLFMCLSYVSNLFHSLKPFRLRNSMFIGSINYFILSLFKFMTILLYLQFPFTNEVISIMILFASLSTVSGLVYKRYKQKDGFAETIFVSIMAISILYALIDHPPLLAFIAPVLAAFAFVIYRYKNTQAPVNLIQVAVLLYSVVIYLVT